jgi:hypothetical protein
VSSTSNPLASVVSELATIDAATAVINECEAVIELLAVTYETMGSKRNSGPEIASDIAIDSELASFATQRTSVVNPGEAVANIVSVFANVMDVSAESSATVPQTRS